MSDEVEWVRIDRQFNVPITDVWSMWTDPQRFAGWYGPKGMSIQVIEMDLVRGGRRMIRMDMQSAERSMTMWFIGHFTDVTEPTRLAYTESMSDEAGNILSPSSMGMPPGHPEVTEVIVQLNEIDGGTLMKLTHVGVPTGSGAASGWMQAIDKLEAQLS